MAGYEIILADPVCDRDRVIGLWKRNLGAHEGEQHEARYDWTHRAPTGGSRHWLALHDGEPVGTAGLNLRHVSVDGKTLLAGVAVDFAVDAKHRMLQPALSLQKAVLATLQQDVGVIYGLPNKKAMLVFQRQGYHRVGELKRYVKVLRTKRFLKSAGGNKAKLASVAPLIDAYLRLKSPETWRRPGDGRVLQRVSDFDARFDDFWQRVQARNPLIGVRDARFLRWRYFDCPLQEYQTLALMKGEQVIGYITWYPGDDEQYRVADLVTDGSDGAIGDLVAGLISLARRDGAASVSMEFLGVDAVEASLVEFGFVKRECAAQLAVSAGPAAGEAVGDGAFAERCGKWHFMRGDENVNTK